MCADCVWIAHQLSVAYNQCIPASTTATVAATFANGLDNLRFFIHNFILHHFLHMVWGFLRKRRLISFISAIECDLYGLRLAIHVAISKNWYVYFRFFLKCASLKRRRNYESWKLPIAIDGLLYRIFYCCPYALSHRWFARNSKCVAANEKCVAANEIKSLKIAYATYSLISARLNWCAHSNRTM